MLKARAVQFSEKFVGTAYKRKTKQVFMLYFQCCTEINLAGLFSSLIAKSEIVHKNIEESDLFRCKYS